MLRDAVRGVVVVAAELAEETGKKVLGAAEGLLARAGVDVEAVERRIAAQFPPTPQSLQTLAGEAVTAGRAGVDLAVGVARSEVERLFEKVGDQVTKVGVVLSFLESKLREVEEEQPVAERTEARAQGLFDAGWETEHEAPARRRAARGAGAEGEKPSAETASAGKSSADATPARKRAARGSAASDGAVAREASAETAPAKRVAAKKAPAKAAAKKTVARKTSASGAAAKTAAGRKAAAKKTVVRRSAQAKKQEESDG